MNEKCNLCKSRNIENIGSHIFTESIIRTALNQEGFTKREDKEIIFQVSTDAVGLNYLGRSVNPEVIEGIKDTVLFFEDRVENPLIDKNLVCGQCEHMFGIVESNFIENVYRKIIRRSITEFSNDTFNYDEYKNLKWITLQFVIINIWRASASKYNWELSSDNEEYLRSFIHKTQSTEPNITVEKTITFKSEICRFHFALNYFIQDSGNLTENGVFVYNSENPYFFLLNRLSILFDFKPFNAEYLPQLLSGIFTNEKLDKLKTGNEADVRITINTNKERKLIFSHLVYEIAEGIIEKFNYTFHTAHKQFFGFEPSEDAVNYYTQKMKEYIHLNNGKISIEEMFKILGQIIIDCKISYNL